MNLLNHIFPLLKGGKLPKDPVSYRPVSLTETWFRIFEKIIFERVYFQEINMYLVLATPPLQTWLSNKSEEGVECKDTVLLDLLRAFNRCLHIIILRT